MEYFNFLKKKKNNRLDLNKYLSKINLTKWE